MDVAVADVPDFEAGRLDPLLDADEVFEGRLVTPRGNVDILDPELLGEPEIVVARVAGDLKRHFDAGLEGRELPGCQGGARLPDGAYGCCTRGKPDKRASLHPRTVRVNIR